MSWTWTDSYKETSDPVFRFDPGESFFQSGRHAAESRFWKLKIHEDGSFARRNASSLDNFYTIKDSLRKEEALEKPDVEEKSRRVGSVEEESHDTSDTSSSSSSSSSSSEDEDRTEEEKKRRKQSKKLKKKSKDKKNAAVTAGDGEEDDEYEEALARAQIERARELERRERELAEREKELERRSREVTPDYSYMIRSRRNSDISYKDYPYSYTSEYAPTTASIQEEGDGKKKKSKDRKTPKGDDGRKILHDNYSTRYY